MTRKDIGTLVGLAVAFSFIGPPSRMIYADQRYATDFEGFQLGSVNGQDNWVVTQIAGGTFDWGVIMDDGTGNKVLEVRSGFSSLNEGSFGGEVRRQLDSASVQRFLQIDMDFQVKDASRFFFDDNVAAAGAPDALFFPSNSVYPADTNQSATFGLNEWHHVGMVVDQDLRGVVQFIFDGSTVPTNDSSLNESERFNRFIFRGAGGGFASAGRLWIDNLRVTDFLPEPSSGGLSACGCLFLLARRRYRAVTRRRIA